MRRVEPVSATQTLPLRCQVLRPGREPSESLFAGAMPDEARHFAAFEDETIVGVGFIVPALAPFEPSARAWQLRGMSVEPDLQGQGIGALIVERVEHEARREGIEILWFNARVKAVGFYRRLGFESVGDEFEIPDVGPHLVMWKRLTAC